MQRDILYDDPDHAPTTPPVVVQEPFKVYVWYDVDWGNEDSVIVVLARSETDAWAYARKRIGREVPHNWPRPLCYDLNTMPDTAKPILFGVQGGYSVFYDS